MSDCSTPCQAAAVVSGRGLCRRQRSLVVRLPGFLVRRQVRLRVLAGGTQTLDVLVHGAKVLLRRLLHAPPRHGRSRLEVFRVYDPRVFGHGGDGPAENFGGGGFPPSPPPPRPPAQPPLLLLHLAVLLCLAAPAAGVSF